MLNNVCIHLNLNNVKISFMGRWEYNKIWNIILELWIQQMTGIREQKIR
jgi:hypothetical protein